MATSLFTMTAFTKADIPSDIDSVEKLAVWVNNVLFRLYPEQISLEGINYSQRTIQSGIYPIDNTTLSRHIGRHSIEMSPDYVIGGRKPWMYAQSLGSQVLTADMKSN